MADGDLPAGLRLGALRAEWAVGASPGKVCFPGVTVVTGDRPDREGDLVRAGDRAGGEGDGELALGELATRRDLWLDLGLGVDPGSMQAFEYFPGAVGRIALDHRVAPGVF
ncbi:hypothetical protein [Micromonospora citrea]|uniref:hypothetical protein n=1 Tax=Micromonospora citrea TaxID=47855 RepID=UPI00114D16F4|nr:hypothetical protein [Micromonospora citrea]